MARTLLVVMAAFSAVVLTVQFAGGESLNDRFGDTAAALFGLSWLVILALISRPILQPWIRR